MTTTDSTIESTPEPRPHAAERESRLDAVFDVLASERCRALIGHLVAEDALTVEDLAARLAEGAPGIRTQLHHTYLPKLEDVGLVEYDVEGNRVRLRSTPEFETLYAAVEDAEEADLPVELDTLFGVLANDRRRRAFRTLLVHGEMALPDLADEVAVAERCQPLSEIDPDDVLQVYLSLYHTHLRKLTEAELVAYDQQGDFVAVTDAGRALEASVRDLCSAVDA